MIDQFRHDTDLSTQQIHFNNAGAALPTKAVTAAMLEYLETESRTGGYEIAADRAEELHAFYVEIAKYLNCRPNQIARAESATRAFNRGVLSIDWQEGDIILTTKSDYISNHLLFLQLRDVYGVVTEIIPEGSCGFDPTALEERLAAGPLPKLVSITHVPTNSGRIQDVVAAGKLCRKHNIWYAVDACQSAGQLPLDVQEIGCDFLSATFRKYLRGPRGIGFLYVSDRVMESKMIPLGLDGQGAVWTGADSYAAAKDARRFETWEENKALKIGAAAAMRYLNETGIEVIQARIATLATLLEERLKRLAGLDVHCFYEVSPNQARTGILLMSVENWTKGPDILIKILRDHGLNATTSGMSHDQFHFREKQIDWALRLSVHYYNTRQEIEVAVDILARVLAENESS